MVQPNPCSCAKPNVDRKAMNFNFAGQAEPCEVVQCFNCGKYAAVSTIGRTKNQAYEMAVTAWNLEHPITINK